MKKEWIKDYFSFTKKERIGVFVLISIILILLFIPYLFPYLKKETKPDKTAFEKEVAKLNQLKIDSAQKTRQYVKINYKEEEEEPNYYQPSRRQYDNSIKGELFSFDPNTISANDWKRLGVKDKTIQTIQNYLSKGGHFYKAEDLHKIYGLREEEVLRLSPNVSIKNNSAVEAVSNETKPAFENKPAKTFSAQIEINSADSSAFISLPGIGTKLSQRILNFRDKLGGFYSVQQVGETFGLPDSTFKKIKPNLRCDNSSIKKININATDINLLKAHPYIKYSLGNVIIQYRNEHGNYSSVEDVKKISFVTDDLFKKIAPYLTVK